MSQPKRYALSEPDISYGTEESPNGEYVEYADYARLQAENARLRKAGDEMAEHFEGFSEWMENADGSPYVSSRLKAWLAAKGVQP